MVYKVGGEVSHYWSGVANKGPLDLMFLLVRGTLHNTLANNEKSL